jgi:phage gp29-like protein
MDNQSDMSRADKLAFITPWINPEERITVQFDDQGDINTVVADCTERLVDLELETPVPHIRQKLSIPLSEIEVSEDPSHYTRDPDKPLQLKRLLLIVKGKRPGIVY